MLVSNPTINSEYTGTAAENATHRIVLYPAEFYVKWPTKITIVLDCKAGSTSVIDKVYFGRSALEIGGNAYDFLNLGTITEVTFGGTPGVTLNGAEEFSDTIEFELHPTQTHVLSIHTTVVGGNTAQYSSYAYAGKFNSYTREGGDWAADVALGGVTTTYADTALFLWQLYENEGMIVSANLPALVAEMPWNAITLPDLQISASMMDRIWVWEPMKGPALELEASVGDRLNIDKLLPCLEIEARMASVSDQEGLLSCLESSSTMLCGAIGTVDKKIGFPTLTVLAGVRVSQKLPELQHSIELSAAITGSVDVDVPFLSLVAAGGREGTGAVDTILFVPELSASSGAKSGVLSSDFFSLDISATGGVAATADSTLPTVLIEATGRPAAVGVSASLFALDISASAGAKQGYVTASVPGLTISATGGPAARLDADLFTLTIDAAGHGAGVGVDRPLFFFDISATGTERQTTLDKDLFVLSISAAASGMQAALDQVLPWLRMDASATAGYLATLEQNLSVPALSSTMLETPLMTLDEDIGALYMGAIAAGSIDPTLPGGNIVDSTLWTSTVLRHSRW
jgi:hypothetical protein